MNQAPKMTVKNDKIFLQDLYDGSRFAGQGGVVLLFRGPFDSLAPTRPVGWIVIWQRDRQDPIPMP